MRSVMVRLWLALVLVTLSCRTLLPAGGPVETPGGGTHSEELPPPAAGTPTANTPPTAARPTETDEPSPDPTPGATPPTRESAAPRGFEVRFHPDGPLYVGDQVSLEVIASVGEAWRDAEAQLAAEPPDSEADETDEEAPQRSLGSVEFDSFGIGRRQQATFLWAWDTSGLEAGEHALSISIVPDGPTWTETVTLLPAEQVPPPEPEARWASAESDCCLIYYITGTEAERDLESLLELVDEQANQAASRLGTELDEAITITLLPRVLGHGGFASDEISVSYLDRNYAGSNFEIVLHHELVHLLDGRLGGNLRPVMLVEGLAVYLSGGHFKPEPLMRRAAALLPPAQTCGRLGIALGGRQIGEPCGLNLFMPLEPLADGFYSVQHEVGYLEAGALVEFMVETWGWEAFSEFYRRIEAQPGRGGHAAAIDASLQAHLGLSLDELERQFVAALEAEQVTRQDVTDVRLTLAYYNTLRRYQNALDPSAYFLTAWLPGNEAMRQRGIVADYLRRPNQPQNIALENLLVAAERALQAGELAEMEELLRAVKSSLDGMTEAQ